MVAKAKLVSEKGVEFECMFNPDQITLKKTNKWSGPSKEKKGANAPTLQFSGGGSVVLSMTVMFDTTDTGESVTKTTDRILKLMTVDPDLPGSDPENNKVRPPHVKFNWGPIKTIPMVITSANVKYSFFGRDGTPLRASVDLELTQLDAAPKFLLQNPTSHTPYPHRVHHVTRGETLDRIANRYYDEPSRWREIAEANAIINPLELTPGTALVIPRGQVIRRG